MVLTIQALLWAGAALFLVGGLVPLFRGKKETESKTHRLGEILLIAAAASGLLMFILRAVHIGRLPISGGADFLLMFSVMVAVAAPIISHMTASPALNGLASLLCLMFYLVVGLLMPQQLLDVSPLVPSLVSPLLSVHVFTAAFSYSCFAVAAGLAALDLYRGKKAILAGAEGKGKADKLQKVQNGIVNAGFFFLSLTIVLGAVWANIAWGAYWSWDPKETWALITWIIYAIYLHQWKKLDKQKAEWMLILGFGLVIFTFFGTNYLLKGLHSYAG